MTEDMFAQKGWICPKCGRVLAPSTMYCLWCCSYMKETITTTTIPKWDTTPIKVGSGMINSNCTERTEPQMEDEILREQCRAFMGIVEQTEREGE